jgi:uncharacterized membrane protein
MNTHVPTTIPEYLAAVRAALSGADPALIQDALYDAEDHLRSELAANPGVDEAALLAKIATSYGSPEEVAEIYRDTEVTVRRAMATPPAPPAQSWLGRIFGVARDPRAYSALIYMLLSLATGVLYFTLTVTGLSMSASFAVLIIGIPFFLLFLGLMRLVSLVEGRVVETLLGVRMPRRPHNPERNLPWLERIKAMLVDPRTWSTLLYMAGMLPLGIVYFTVAVAGLAVSLALIGSPIAYFVLDGQAGVYLDGHQVIPPGIALPIAMVIGVLLLFVVLHLARAIGHVHGRLAHHLLVKVA